MAEKSWYQSLVGKKVTVRDQRGILYKGRFLAYMNRRIFLQDVRICKDKKDTGFSLLSLDLQGLSCLYTSSDKITRIVNLQKIARG